jgi:hypothetical protein
MPKKPIVEHEHQILGDGTTFHCTSCPFWRCMRHGDIGVPYIEGLTTAGCPYCKKARDKKKHDKRQ